MTHELPSGDETLAQGRPGPRVLAFIICDSVHRDTGTGKAYILGTFSRIGARTLPAKHRRLHVYLALTDGHGDANARLQLVNVADDTPLAKLQGPIHFPSPLTVVEMDFEILNLVFPAAGQYEFRFSCNGEQIAQRPFEVALRGDATERKL